MNIDDFENVIPKRAESDNKDKISTNKPVNKDSSTDASDLQNKTTPNHNNDTTDEPMDKLSKNDTGTDTSDVSKAGDTDAPAKDNFFDTSSDHFDPHDDPAYENDGGAPAEPKFDQEDAKYDPRQDGYHGDSNAKESSGDKKTDGDSVGDSSGKEMSPTNASDKESFVPDKVFGDLAGDGHVEGASSGNDGLASMITKGAKQAANTGASILKSIASIFTNGIASIANALGTSVKAVKIVGGLTGTTGIILIIALFLGLNTKKVNVIYDVDCDMVEDAANSNRGSEMESADKIATAKRIYEALGSDSIGYSDQAIAGMLSCGECETGLDPTAYEGNYLHNSAMDAKAKANDWNGYTLLLFDAYARSGVGISKSSYMYEGKYYPAFGVWQWTGPRTGGLMNFANAYAKDKDGFTPTESEPFNDRIYDLDVQLAYCLKENCSGVNEWARGASASKTPYECAVWFWSNWEGANTSKAEHCDNAQMWYDTITSEGWATDNTYGTSIIEMAQIELTEAGARGVHAAYEDSVCEEPEVNNFDNSSIAAAAVGWAWPKGHADYADINDSDNDAESCCCGTTRKMSFCTSQYIYCHNLVLQGYPTHASSCDRGVAVAIRVAGVDDNFNPGTISGTCLPYLMSSEHWEHLGTLNDRIKEEMQPGDILCSDGHIVVFVGGEEAAKKWPDLYKSADECKYGIVHASHSSTYSADGSDSRGPRFDPDCGTWMYGEFHVFRPKGRTQSSKYKDLVDANKEIIAKQRNGSEKCPASELHTNCKDFEDKLFDMKTN